jgi:hypothetical protein
MRQLSRERFLVLRRRLGAEGRGSMKLAEKVQKVPQGRKAKGRSRGAPVLGPVEVTPSENGTKVTSKATEAPATPSIETRAAEKIALLVRGAEDALRDFSCAVGRVVAEEFYHGDVHAWRAWRERGSQDTSLRKLSQILGKAGLLSPTALYRCLATYELVHELGGVSAPKHLTMTHIHEVLTLPPPKARDLLDRAASENWPTRRLREEVKFVRLNCPTTSKRAPRARSRSDDQEANHLQTDLSDNRARTTTPTKDTSSASRFLSQTNTTCINTILELERFVLRDELYEGVDELAALPSTVRRNLIATLFGIRRRCDDLLGHIPKD